MKTNRITSNLLHAVVGCLALLGASMASAAVLVPGSGIYVFSGGVTLTYNSGTGPVNYACNMAVKTVFDIDPPGTGIEATMINANLAGCGITPLMPWYTSAPGAPPPFPGFVPDVMFPPFGGPPAMPVPVQVNNMNMTTPLGLCGAANVPATYDNNPAGAASSFMFAGAVFGACTLHGVLNAVPAAAGFIGTAPDVDAFL